MKIKPIIARAIATLAAIAAYGAAHAAFDGPAHLSAADSLVSKLRSQGEAGLFTTSTGTPLNHYGASWSSAYAIWNPTAMVDAQCSSFVTLVMQASYPGWTAKGAGFGTASPTAAMYHDAIETNTHGFAKVADFNDIMPGDFLMAKYYDDSASTGHAMIVRDAQEIAVDPNTGITTWAVQVIDCSKSGHSSDSRDFLQANGTVISTNGAGRGTMCVMTQNGAIVAYAWSFNSGSTLYTPSVRHLTLGRLAY